MKVALKFAAAAIIGWVAAWAIFMAVLIKESQ